MITKTNLLTDLDRNSSTWNKLVAYYEERLFMLRVQNDAPKNDDKTAHIRGRIQEIKELLALANPDVINESDDLDTQY